MVPPADSGGAIDATREADGAEDSSEPDPRALVLLVEDDLTQLRTLAVLIESLGHRVLQAQSAAAALELMHDHDPNVVIADLNMPRISGFELLERLQRSHPDLPKIVATGAEGHDTVLQSLRHGAYDFLLKPVLLEQLRESIARALRQDRMVRENRQAHAKLEGLNRRLKAHLSEIELDQKAGHRVQLGMLPPNPMGIGPFRLQHRIYPSRLLSGDFIDYFEITPGHFAFYVADVAGHGASSAFVTVLLKNFSRRLRREYRPDWLTDPGAILAWLNRELIEMDLDKHVTLFLGVIDQASMVLHWANAGHFPPPLIADGQGIAALERSSAPLGLFADASYDSDSVQLQVPFALVAFSDGILELFQDRTLSEKETALRQALTPETQSVNDYLNALALAEPAAAPDDVALLLLTCRTSRGRANTRS